MSALDLIDRARSAGLKLEPRGDKLHVRGPKPLPADLLDALRERKAEVLEALGAERSPEGVGPYRPPSNLRECWSCGGGLQPNDDDGDLCGTCRWSMGHLEPGRVQ